MARTIYSKLKINGTLIAETPLHVGGIGGNTDTDMALAINGKGGFYIPGTSIAGVLRSWCRKNYESNSKLIEKIFGYQETNGKKVGTASDESHASFVLIEDAVVKNSAEVLTEIRDGVGIDRFYGTAADKTKYDREILPKGTQLDFEMTVEIDKSENAANVKSIFGYLLEALENKELRFGGSRTRGLGRIKLKSEEIKEQQLKNFAGLKDDFLKQSSGEYSLINENPFKISELKGDLKPQEKPQMEIIIDWSPVQSLMVKAGFEGIGVDTLPLTSGVEDKKVSLVLPGSSIKGALRTQAERIMRTLLQSSAKDLVFPEQISNITLIDELFGAKAGNNDDTKGLAALAVDDCYAEKSFDQEDWKNVTIGKTTENGDDVSYEKQELWKALRKLDGADIGVVEEVKKDTKNFKIAHHNAIDRFTGGAADSALYSVLVPNKISWNEINLSLDFSRLEGKEKQCLMLLLLVLRDLAENRLPLGFATNRGMGEIKVKSFGLKPKGFEKLRIEGDVYIEVKDGKFAASDNLKSFIRGENWWKTEKQ